jgi:Hint-domain/U-box domain/VWA / Hh  protein intein-like/von Willebrand factor type A domain
MASSIPNEFYCPITFGLMQDPVIAADGHTYEREAIEQWLVNHSTSPKTNLPLTSTNLIPNIALRNTIRDMLAKQPLHFQTPKLVGKFENKTLVAKAYPADAAIHLTIKAEEPETRQPIVLLAIVDTSGSMAESTDDEKSAEAYGFSRLDLVKHTVRTMAAVLGDDDMLSIITYSTNAQIVLRPTRMNKEGKARVEAALEYVKPDSQTNIYEGLRHAMEIANTDELAGRNIVGLLLTDGFPNINPPRGILYELQNRIVMKNPWTLHTFGFGYKLDSKLLADLALWGNGLFGFIPDATMVGTVFINFLASVLSSAARNPELMRDGKPIYLHNSLLQGGQTYETVISYSGQEICLNGKVVPLEAEPIGCTFALAHRELIETLENVIAIESSNRTGATIESLKTLSAKFAASSDPRILAFSRDLTGLDPEGQLGLAVSPAHFGKWGEHYLRSYLRAQKLQMCLNFKDPGVQIYGGPLFKEMQAIAEKAFGDLPPPTPSVAAVQNSYYGGLGPPTSIRSTTQTMSIFHNSGGGCFHGENRVLMADGSRKAIKDINPDDQVWTPEGTANVVCLVTIGSKRPAQTMVQINGLCITPWHPIRLKAGGPWVFPADYYLFGERLIQTVYNFVLNKGHVVDVEGYECITLAHGFEEPVAKHVYFGTSAVLNDLAKQPGYFQGRPVYQNLVAKKDPATGLIVGWYDDV